jgi:TonB family protein
MRTRIARLVIVLACLFGTAAAGQTPQASQGDSPFAGRWELALQPPAGMPLTLAGGRLPLLLVEISGTGTALSVKLVDGLQPFGNKGVAASVKEGELLLTCDMSLGNASTLSIRVRRVGDRLEGKAAPSGETEVDIVGRRTNADKLTPFELPKPTPETQALAAAMAKPRSERTEALKQFLKDNPNSPQKETAAFELALSYQNADERTAALRAFMSDFPDSSRKEQARLEIALTPSLPADKAAGMRRYLEEFPKSPLKERAEMELANTAPRGAERRAAIESFLAKYPKGVYASGLLNGLLEEYTAITPPDTVALARVVDAYTGAFVTATTDADKARAASVFNTVADRLMVKEVLLDKALDLIQRALPLGEKSASRLRAMYQTTYGQVLFKQKRYDEAERELKRAIEIAGADGEAEAQLYLGKVYEAKLDYVAAFDTYFAAAVTSMNRELKSSLERVYTRLHGSLAGLDDKLDAAYRARPKPFEPGRYARPAAAKRPARVVLAELFTGSECSPCVAADLGFDGVAERYDRAEVGVLVYHLHIPGPDPMTNADSEARATYYGVNSTPTAIVDGLERRAGGGGATQASGVFNDYKQKIEARLALSPLASLDRFKARVAGATIEISGTAALTTAGAAKAKKPVLRVALAQDVVRYVGGNGVRFHQFVVRKLVGPGAGTPLQVTGARTTFRETVDLASVRDGLNHQLTKYELNRSDGRAGAIFQDRPTGLDPAHLLVIAFVQDLETKEILQVSVVTPSGSGLAVPAESEAEQQVLAAQAEYGRASARADEALLNQIWMPEYSFINGNGVEVSRERCLAALKATAGPAAPSPVSVPPAAATTVRPPAAPLPSQADAVGEKVPAPLSAAAAPADRVDRNTDRPYVRIQGDTAVVTGRRMLGSRYSGVSGVTEFHYLEVWVKDGGRWRLLSNQLTPLRSPSTPAAETAKPTAAPGAPQATPLAGADKAIRVGGSIQPPTRTNYVAPVYPDAAQKARVQGFVVVEALIGEGGAVQDARIVRSIPLLDQPALEAVRQWTFTPTTVDGKPVSVIMTVTVSFTLK